MRWGICNRSSRKHWDERRTASGNVTKGTRRIHEELKARILSRAYGIVKRKQYRKHAYCLPSRIANVTAPADLSLSRSRMLFLKEEETDFTVEGFMWRVLCQQVLALTSKWLVTHSSSKKDCVTSAKSNFVRSGARSQSFGDEMDYSLLRSRQLFSTLHL